MTSPINFCQKTLTNLDTEINKQAKIAVTVGGKLFTKISSTYSNYCDVLVKKLPRSVQPYAVTALKLAPIALAIFAIISPLPMLGLHMTCLTLSLITLAALKNKLSAKQFLQGGALAIAAKTAILAGSALSCGSAVVILASGALLTSAAYYISKNV